jgi:hypothetical protein
VVACVERRNQKTDKDKRHNGKGRTNTTADQNRTLVAHSGYVPLHGLKKEMHGGSGGGGGPVDPSRPLATNTTTTGNATVDAVAHTVGTPAEIAHRAEQAAKVLNFAAGRFPQLANVAGALETVGHAAGPLAAAMMIIQMAPMLNEWAHGRASNRELFVKAASVVIPGAGALLDYMDAENKRRIAEEIKKHRTEAFNAYMQKKKDIEDATAKDVETIKKGMDQYLARHSDDGSIYGDQQKRVPFPAEEPIASENNLGPANPASGFGAQAWTNDDEGNKIPATPPSGTPVGLLGQLYLSYGSTPYKAMGGDTYETWAQRAGETDDPHAPPAQPLFEGGPPGDCELDHQFLVEDMEPMTPADAKLAREIQPINSTPTYGKREFYDEWAKANSALVVDAGEFYGKKKEAANQAYKDAHGGQLPWQEQQAEQTRLMAESGAYLTPEERAYMNALPEGDAGKKPTAVMALFKQRRESGQPAPVPGTGAAPVAAPTSEPGFQAAGEYPAPQTQEEQDKFNDFFAVGGGGYSAEGLQTQDDQFQYWRAHDPSVAKATGSGKRRRVPNAVDHMLHYAHRGRRVQAAYDDRFF